MKITGGTLKDAFGPEAYFRIVPQSNSTFQGNFDTSFSGSNPLTNLRALQSNLPAAVPEPTTIALLFMAAAGIVARRSWQRRKGAPSQEI